MNQKDRQTLIDPKDLFFAIIKKAGLALIVGLVLACALFGYKYISGAKEADILDASVRLEDETDIEYAERVNKINRAVDIINSVDALNGQISNLREYVSDSLIMQINTENEAVTTAQLIITIDDELTNGIDRALVSSYSQALKSGDYLASLAEEMNTKQGYLTELIRVEYSASTTTVVNAEEASGSAGTITIAVIGPNTEITQKIMECILDEVNTEYDLLNDTMVSHTISLASEQSFYTVDSDTRDLQYNVTNRFETIQKQIGLYNDSLDEIASDIGVTDRNSLYAYYSFNAGNNDGSSIGGAIKFAVIGFLCGCILILCFASADYLWGKKFSTQSKFFGRFPYVNRVGVVKPSYKRSAFVRYVDINTGDDNALSVENSNKLIAANVKNAILGMDKVLFTGTAEESRIKDLVNSLGVKVDIKESVFTNPTVLESFSDYDGIIIVEQRNYSNCQLVEEELALIANAKTKIIGAIII